MSVAESFWYFIGSGIRLKPFAWGKLGELRPCAEGHITAETAVRLKRILSINIAVLAAMSTFVLGMGHGTFVLAFWTVIAAAASIWLTDTLQVVRLNHRWANIAILGIVIFSVGDLVATRGDSLALGIARILVFMQMVLLFRDKDQRCFGHLLALSILQVVVAAAFEQGAAFGILLVVYVFMLLSASCLLFLYTESVFYREHAETQSHYGLRSSLYLKQTDWRMLRKVAFATFIAGPFSLFLQKEHGTDKKRSLKAPDKPKKVKEEAAARRRFRKRGPDSISAGRWPQAFEEPHFDGASVSSSREGVRASLWGLTASITAKSAMLAFVVFLITPRAGNIELGPFSLDWGWGNSGGGIRTIGVPTDSMNLGEFGGAAYQSHETVMMASFRRAGTAYPYEVSDVVYLHGREFTHYHNKVWTEPETPESGEDWFGDRPRSSRIPRPSAEEWNEAVDADDVDQMLGMEPMKDNLVFCVHPFHSTESQRRRVTIDTRGQLIRTSNPDGQWGTTFGTAGFKDGRGVDVFPCVEQVDIGAMASSPDSEVFSGLIALADQWIAESNIPASNPIGRARYLERQLRDSGDFYYSLDSQDRDPTEDPIEDFVTDTRIGHCEFFASALTLMLRSQGIPARVVVGYCGGLYNPLGKYYQFRGMDAHSWVQAYIAPQYLDHESAEIGESDLWNSGAWLRLDATPESDPSMLGDLAGQMTGWKDRLTYLWQRYVVGMDGAQQSNAVYGPLGEIGGVIKDLFHGSWWHTQWLRLKNIVQQNWYALKEGHWISVRGGITASLLALLGYLAYRLLRFLFRLGRKTAGFLAGHAPQHLGSRIDFYRRLEQILGEHGLHRRAGQTQREFAVAAGEYIRANPIVPPKPSGPSTEHSTDEKDSSLISDEPCNEMLSDAPREICEAFYRVRFGNEKLQTHDRRCIDKALRALRK
jgi:protein-glutamine gamma-glutamyltransferase